MLKELAGKIWRKIPWFARLKIIRLTQTKFTVSVAAIIFNDAGKILILDHVYRPGSGWGIPGGFINPDEQPEIAVRRELQEETGLQIENVRLFHARTVKKHVEFIFEAEANGAVDIVSNEIFRAEWLDFDEIPEEMSAIQRDLIKQVLEKRANGKK